MALLGKLLPSASEGYIYTQAGMIGGIQAIQLGGFIKTIRLLFGISIFWLSLSMLSDGINSLVLPNLLLKAAPANSQATVLGLLTFFGLLAAMLVQPYAGALSDRLRPRWGRLGMIGLGVLMVLLSLGVFGALRGLLFVILGYLFLQVALSVAQAAQQGFIPDLAPPHLRGRASGLKSFMDIGGAMFGFLLLGQALSSGNSSSAFLVLGGILFSGFLLTALFVREPRKPGNGEKARPPARLLINPFRLNFRKEQAFVRLVAARFLFLLGTFAVGRFLLFFVSDRLSLQAAEASAQAGTLLAILALVTVLASFPAGWAADRFGRVPVMRVGALANSLGTLLLIFSSSIGSMALFGALMSVGNAAFNSANWAMTADLAPANEGGRFYGLANIGMAGASAAAGLFGPLVDFGNNFAAGMGYTILFVLASVVALLGVWVLGKMPASAPAAAATSITSEI